MTMIDVVTITTDGAVTHESIDRGAAPLQQRVGGWIEAVSSDDGSVTLWVNEEGKLQGLPVNAMATELWHMISPHMKGVDVLCGTVVVTGGCDDEGETLSIPDSLGFALRVVSTAADEINKGRDGVEVVKELLAQGNNE